MNNSQRPALSPPRRAAAVFLAAVLCGLIAALAGAAETPKKIIIDTDPGTDDAMAIMLALNSPELDVKALTVVPGNVPLSTGIVNARRLASLAHRCDIPVAAGSDRPLVRPFKSATYVHGKNGLAGVELDVPECPLDPRFGPDLIIEMVHKYPGEITLVPIGPLTNIALAILKDPSIVPLVKEVILMGGSISGGNVTPAAEFNVWVDPDAAHDVFQAGWPITMVGLDVTNKTLFTPDHLAELQKTHGPINDFAAAITGAMIEHMQKFGLPGMAMHDPLAVGVTIDPTLVRTECYNVDVETQAEMTRGETVADRRAFAKPEHCTRVAVEAQSERFLQLFISRLSGK